MFLCTYIVLKASSFVTFIVIFVTRASVVCIDSGTRDTIRVSLALAIRFFDISINRYTPIDFSLVRFCGIHPRAISWVNSSSPSAAYMRQWSGSALVQVMACCLFGTKPLPEPMLVYCHLDSWEHTSVKFESELYHFHSKNAVEIVVCQNDSHFVQGEMG